MKKVFRFLKSMKFGMLLLTLIIVFSLAGSLIIQGNDASYYEQTYPSVSSIILTLGFDRVFSTWYYVALMALLCVNLVLCSVIRLNNVIKQSRGALVSAQKAPLVRVSKKEQERIHAALQARHLKRMPVEGGVVYHRNYPFGYYGSFLTHFGLLLTLVFAGCAMWLASTEDHSLAIGQTVNLYDGVSITLDQFRLKDEEGHIDYVSNIHVTDANGNDSGPQEVSVNYPHSFGGPKYFQQGYGALGSMTITNDGKSDTILLDGPMFLSLDGVNGVAFHTLYPDHAVDENGHVTPLQSADYKFPVYLVAVTSDK